VTDPGTRTHCGLEMIIELLWLLPVVVVCGAGTDLLICHTCRSEFIGRGELADRQQKLNAMLAALRRVSEVEAA
jgi:hypothetical protein